MFDGLVQSQGSAVSKNKERRKIKDIIQLLFDYLLELKVCLEIQEIHRYPFFFTYN